MRPRPPFMQRLDPRQPGREDLTSHTFPARVTTATTTTTTTARSKPQGSRELPRLGHQPLLLLLLLGSEHARGHADEQDPQRDLGRRRPRRCCRLPRHLPRQRGQPRDREPVLAAAGRPEEAAHEGGQPGAEGPLDRVGGRPAAAAAAAAVVVGMCTFVIRRVGAGGGVNKSFSLMLLLRLLRPRAREQGGLEEVEGGGDGLDTVSQQDEGVVHGGTAQSAGCRCCRHRRCRRCCCRCCARRIMGGCYRGGGGGGDGSGEEAGDLGGVAEEEVEEEERVGRGGSCGVVEEDRSPGRREGVDGQERFDLVQSEARGRAEVEGAFNVGSVIWEKKNVG
ncbi:hypothetical protein L209DRAFT_450894 [Thermothelomyces heterothallicus CBS 203.75]